MRDCRTIWRYTGSESVSGMRKLSPLTSAADVSSCLCLSLTGTCFTLPQRGNKLSKSVLMSILSGFFTYVLLFDYHPMKKIRAHIVWKVLKVKNDKDFSSLLFFWIKHGVCDQTFMSWSVDEARQDLVEKQHPRFLFDFLLNMEINFCI